MRTGGKSGLSGTCSMSKTGVTEYAAFTANIFFEKNHEGCEWCPLMETYARKQCRLTGTYLLDTRVRDYWCPLKEKENETK